MSKPFFSFVALWAAFLTGITCQFTQASEELLPSAPAAKQWKLIWHDEFDGPNLDESKWNRLGDSKRRDGFWVKEDAYLSGTGTLLRGYEHYQLRFYRNGERQTRIPADGAGCESGPRRVHAAEARHPFSSKALNAGLPGAPHEPNGGQLPNAEKVVGPGNHEHAGSSCLTAFVGVKCLVPSHPFMRLGRKPGSQFTLLRLSTVCQDSRHDQRFRLPRFINRPRADPS